MTRRQGLMAALALILLTLIAYAPVLTGHAGYIWDDNTHVTQNAALHDGQGLIDLWTWGPRALFNHAVKPATQQYYPATFTTFWIEYQLWGTHPLGYHLDNILLHLLSAFLIWSILRRLGLRAGTAFFAAALFAVHPVNVESVAWISERKNTLSLALALASALCWLHWNRLETPSAATQDATRKTQDFPRPFVWLFWAILLFALALLAKSVTVILPAVLLVIAWWKRGTLRPIDISGVIPMFLLGALAASLTITIETSNAYIGAFGEDFAFTFAQRCLIAGRAIWFYLAKLLNPLHLAFIYPRWNLNTASVFQWLAPIAVLAVLATLFVLRKRIGRTPFTVALLFILSLAPALGFINFYPMQFSFVADHFQYMATIAICTAIAGVLALAARRFHLPALLAAVPLLALTALSYKQAAIYQDEQTLYRATLAANPDAWMASENLAVLLVAQNGEKSYPEVIDLYRRTLALNPRDAKAYNSLAGTLLAMHQYPEAETSFRKGLELRPADASLEAGLGAALLLQNKFDDAAAHYTLACARAPSNPEYLAGYGNALLHAGHPDLAEQQFRAALDLHTGPVAVYRYYLGLALRDQGKLGPALDAFQKSIKLDPQRPEPFLEVGDLLARLHKDSMAVDYFQSALHLQPDYLPAKIDLARLLLISDEPGRADPVWAADLYRQADEETGGKNIPIKIERAAALASAKAYDAAVDLLQDVVSPTAPTPLSAEDRERILQIIQKYQIAAAPPLPQDPSRGAPVSRPDAASIFQAYPSIPTNAGNPNAHIIPPP